ncbi:rhodanese-like domain-containing protein [Actinosynnema sp. NPDC059335]|uniref:rhodanese-like domain-containing protein n=1 Tax=Actinosynnema sp. NPDC059335 TaxID=3346804 RepID=UPI0036727A85
MERQIDHNAFAARLAEEDVFVVDVRDATEYRQGHVPGAHNVPLSVLPTRVGELPEDRPVFVICQTGGRSARAASLLGAVGVDAVNVLGGTDAWIASGRPVETSTARGKDNP